MVKRLILCALVSTALVSAAPAASKAAPTAQKQAAKVSLSQSIRARVAAALDQLESNNDYPAAKAELHTILDQVIAYGGPKDLDAFRDAAFAVRLVGQLEKLRQSERPELLKYLRANEAAARPLVFLVREKDKPANVYALFNRLRQERAEQVKKYATLAAAISIVHDRPFERNVNENKVKAPDPLAIFDYYVKNERYMLFGIQGVPAELLIYVVDTTSSIDEMNWALQRYAGEPKVGRLFFDIKYDWEHFRRGTPKKVTVAGFNLPNILECGGVCADQAYFATAVGKSIGVLTAYASGAAGQSAHAWVGFLQAQGRQGWWNFDIGRYDAYQGVKGSVLDPQLRESIPDSYVSLLAELIGTRPQDREAGIALTDAALRLMEQEKAGEFAPAPLAADVLPTSQAKPRKATVEAQLELVELALRQSPGDRHAWFVVRDLAKDGKLSLAQKRRWAEVLTRLCGQKYPDFLLAILGPMIQTIDDVKEQERLWNAAFDLFKTRSDLAASVRMSQAEMYERAGQIDRAGMCYMDVIERFANAGPFVIKALEKAEAALKSSNRADRVLVLYEQTWSRIKKPGESAFMNQSNWVRVGKMYAKRLGEAGESAKAETVSAQLTITPAAGAR